ncbi:MAG: glutaredoxin family protein [Rhodoferax sp.]|nr:glutaredoxin family protein [Rhodoferax sp.]
MKHHSIALLLGSAALVLGASGVQAQTIYRIVGADGKVTFSDKPPVSAEQGKVATTGVGAAAANPSSGMPFELRQVVTKYPVVLYTSTACAPCDAGRSLLLSRGVPFSERTVATPEDRAYLQRLTGDNSLPYLTIGTQRIKGLSDLEWTQYLDAAGYPKTSQLPATYRNAAPTPLVAIQTPAAPASKPADKPDAAKEAPPYQPPPANPSNPAGIQF